LSSTDLKDAFKRALEFLRPFLQMSAAELAASGGTVAPLTLGDADKLRFYGYFKQATRGDQPARATSGPGTPTAGADPVEAAKLDAWAAVRGTSRRDAMRLFVHLLDRALPAWEAYTAHNPAPS
jgi:acyl-CoA-binding protein